MNIIKKAVSIIVTGILCLSMVSCAAFLKKNEKLVAYYNAMHPWEGQDFDGDNMKGEACADMAAVT